MTLRAKYAGATAALVGTMLLSAVGLISHSQHGVLVKDAQRRTDVLMDGVLRIAQESVRAKDELMLYSYLLVLRQQHPELSYVEVRRGTRTTKSIGENAPGLRMLTRAVPAQPGMPDDIELHFGFAWGVIEAEVAHAMHSMLVLNALIGGVFMSMGGLLAFYVARRLTAPLGALACASDSIGKGKMETRVQEGGNDEVGVLARQFNRMVVSLQDLMRFREEVLHTLTHELNTPLAGLKGYLELWQDGKLGESSGEREEVLGTMMTAVARMEASLSGALLMFRAEERRRHPERNKLVWVNEVINEQILLFAGVAQGRRLTLKPLPEDVMGCIYTEEDLLRQAVTNVLSNAVKYTPDGGEIRVGLKTTPQELTLWVADSGPGIPPEAQKNLFQKFERAGAGRRSQAFGTGLGLNIAKRSVEAMGGRIWAESVPGQGTTFYIAFPKEVRAKAEPVEAV